MLDLALATIRVYTDHGTYHPVAIRLRATTPRTLAFRASMSTSDARDALNLAREIHDAQQREAEPRPIDGSDHPVTCRRRCCR